MSGRRLTDSPVRLSCRQIGMLHCALVSVDRTETLVQEFEGISEFDGWGEG